MRDIVDLLVAVAGIWVGWWACDIHRNTQRDREFDRLLSPIGEPPSDVLSIVEDDGDGLLA